MILAKNYYENIKINEYKITIYGGRRLIKVVFPARNFQNSD